MEAGRWGGLWKTDLIIYSVEYFFSIDFVIFVWWFDNLMIEYWITFEKEKL